jgi:two-component system, NarL family, nitrate/nitrite response regulator NarL
VRVLLAAETRVYRESLERTLSDTAGRVVVAGACRPDELFAGSAAGVAADLVLLQEQIPAGPVTARRLRAANRRVLAIGVGESERELTVWVVAGVFWCALHDTTLNELVSMIERVARGFRCYPSTIATSSLSESSDQPSGLPRLTRRELEILVLIEQGLSNKEIAARLTLQLATVKNHVHNLFAKLGVRRRFEAIEWLRRNRPLLGDGGLWSSEAEIGCGI